MSDVTFANFSEHKVKTGESLDSIARKNGTTWQQLARFNFGTSRPREINDALHEQVGCWKKTRDARNYVFTTEDEPGIILVPRKSPIWDVPTTDTHTFRLQRPKPHTQVEIQTVDEFEHRVPNVALVLKGEEGQPDVPLTTDSTGYGRVRRVLIGKYRVLLADGSPTFYLTGRHEPHGASNDPDYGTFAEAVLDTVNHTRSVTRVVVRRAATEEERRERRERKDAYLRTGKEESVQGRGEETKGPTKRSHFYCADNLALAAGWTEDFKVDLRRLVSGVLHGYLEDYHPTAIARGYYVMVIEPATGTLTVMDQGGTVAERLHLASGVQLSGLVGAYAVFEDIDANRFLDMASLTTVISRLGVDGEVLPEIYGLDEIVTEPEKIIEAVNARPGKVGIVCYTPTAPQLAHIALHGGTGRLEDYGHDEAVNASVHERNLAVCHSIRRIYEVYVNDYIERVRATKDEAELRRLGPPRPPYEMPPPAGATPERRMELLEAYAEVEIEPWLAIAHQLDRFANRKAQGYPFLRIKPKYKVSSDKVARLKDKVRPGVKWLVEKPPVAVDVELELQIDIQIVDGEIEVITKGDAVLKETLKPETVVKKVTKKGFPVELSAKQSLGNPDKQSVSVKISKFQMEVDTVGKTKLSLEALPGVIADTEVNTFTGEFGSGITIKFKDLAKALKDSAEQYDWLPAAQRERLLKWANLLESVEVQVLVGFVGTREETILATVSHAPGFFERRPIKELFDAKTKWNDLTLDEQRNLAILGWTQLSWDQKHRPAFTDFPESVQAKRLDLSPEERVAIVHLGFYAYEEYKSTFEKHRIEFANYVF